MRCYVYTSDSRLYSDVAAGRLTVEEGELILSVRRELLEIREVIDRKLSAPIQLEHGNESNVRPMWGGDQPS